MTQSLSIAIDIAADINYDIDGDENIVAQEALDEAHCYGAKRVHTLSSS